MALSRVLRLIWSWKPFHGDERGSSADHGRSHAKPSQLLTLAIGDGVDGCSIERRHLVNRHQDLDGTSPTGCSFDEPVPFEGEDHVVNGWWCHVEVALKVGFGRSAAVQFGVRHDERQVLTLKLRELLFQEWIFLQANLYQPSNLSSNLQLEPRAAVP